MKKILFLFAVVLISGCATPSNVGKMSPEQISQKSTVERDDFIKSTVVRGMPMVFGSLIMQSEYSFQAYKPDTSEVFYVLHVKSVRSYDDGWAFWESAFDRDGNKLKFLKHDSDVQNGGITYEYISFEVTREWLDKASKKGEEVRLDGKRASQILKFPANYASAFMTSVHDQLHIP